MQEERTRAPNFPTVETSPAAGATTAPVIRSLISNEKIEELIDEVEKRPALYKKELKQYSDVNVKKKLWEEVCEKLISNWSKLSENERKTQGHDIQKKWNNLRTCFSRELKAQKSVKSGQAASKRRPFVYFERMLFLVPCMEPRPTEGSIDRPTGSSIDNRESGQDDANLSEGAQSHPNRKRGAKRSDFDEQLLKALQANDDDDTNYCLSLVPFMKDLTSDEKLEIRIKILQTFQDIKKKRLLPNTCFGLQPGTSTFSRRAAPSTSIQIISDELISPRHPPVRSTNQSILSQPTQSQQQSTRPLDYFEQLSSPSPEIVPTPTPPPQRSTQSPHDSTVTTYWSNYAESSDSELIDL